MKSIHIPEYSESFHLFGNLNYCDLNVNPLKLHSEDSHIRAVALLLNLPWDESFMELSRVAFSLKLSLNDPRVIQEILEKHGFQKITLLTNVSAIHTMYELSKIDLKGRYFISVPGHAYPILNEICYDTVLQASLMAEAVHKMKEEHVLMALYKFR